MGIIRAALFDLDDTLLDRQTAFVRVAQVFYSSYAAVREKNTQARIPHLAQTSDAVNRQLSCFSSRYMNLLAVFQI